MGFLQTLNVKLPEHWKMNETFFDTLTKTAVCVEIGLAKAAGARYADLKAGSKNEIDRKPAPMLALWLVMADLTGQQ